METDQKSWKEIKPISWKPEKAGDQISGVLINKIAKNDSAKIGARYFLKNDTGKYVIWGSVILDERMEFVNVGQDVKIVFDGKSRIDNGKKLNLFTVSVSRFRADPSGKDNDVNSVQEETVFE